MRYSGTGLLRDLLTTESCIQQDIKTDEEDEDVFQCGKCKKQFTSLAVFVSHKQTPCGGLQQPQQQLTAPPLTLQQPQPSQITLNAGPHAFASTINMSRPFTQTQLKGNITTMNTDAPILQAHPCLTRSLNQLSTAVTGPLTGQAVSSPNVAASVSAGITGNPDGSTATFSGLATALPSSHLLVQPDKISPEKKMTQTQDKFVTDTDNSPSLMGSRRRKSSVSRNSERVGVVKEEEENASKPKLKCEYCSKLFTKNFDLQQHIRAHTGEKPFQCIVCGRAFAQKSNVKKHMKTHKVWPTGTSNTLPQYPSPVIEERAAGETSIPVQSSVEQNTYNLVSTSATTTHELLKSTAHQVMDFQIPCSQYNTTLKIKLPDGGDKQDTDGVKSEKSRVPEVVVDNSYVCQYCPAKFGSYYQLKSHLVTHKDEQVYKCVLKSCGQSFPQLEAFLEHIKSHETDLNYRCHQCNKYFKSLYDLGVHQYTHVYLNQGVKSGPRHFRCTKCGNKYATPEALEHHMSTTTHDYKCPLCQKLFTCERLLRQHLHHHGTDGQFECEECKKKFKTEHYLKAHMLTHTEETPYVCDVCPAAFKRKDHLKRHMTIHDGVKKYKCPFKNIAGCRKEFDRPDKLKAHIITHSGIKPLKCSICSKSFSRRPHLVEHERRHNLDFDFKCDKCGKGFFRPKLFREHKATCQPSKYGLCVEQTFIPRNRRKVGRPKKRPVSISPDSLAKSRGKQYLSHTRGKAMTQVMQILPENGGASEVHNDNTCVTYLSVKQRLKHQQQQKILRAEMNAAAQQQPDFVQTNTLHPQQQGAKVVSSVLSEEHNHKLVELSGGGNSYKITGEEESLVDSKMFTIVSIEGNTEYFHHSVGPSGSHSEVFVKEEAGSKSETKMSSESSTLVMLSGSSVVGEQGEEDVEPADNGASLLLGIGASDNRSLDVRLGLGLSSNDHVDVNVKIEEDEDREGVIGRGQSEGENMMERALSLFDGRDSFVGGQVVVSGDQAYITCSSDLVDYTSTE